MKFDITTNLFDILFIMGFFGLMFFGIFNLINPNYIWVFIAGLYIGFLIRDKDKRSEK